MQPQQEEPKKLDATVQPALSAEDLSKASFSQATMPKPETTTSPALPSFQTLECAIQDGIMKVTLNRPQVLNSINEDMATDLAAAVKHANENPAVKAVLLTGNGRAFCAGQEISGDVFKIPDLEPIVAERYNPLILSI